MDKSICKLIIWPKIFAIDYTELLTSSSERLGLPECMSWVSGPHTNKASVSSLLPAYQMHHQSDLLLWNIFQLMLKNWNGVNLSIIEIYGIWKGWAESSEDNSGSSGQWQWMVSPRSRHQPMSGAAAASTCGEHQPGTRGQQLDVTTGQMGPMMMMILCRWEQILKMDFVLGVCLFFEGCVSFLLLLVSWYLVVFTN